MNEIQKELLKMALDIKQVAERHNIRYSLSGGTAIGAIRDKGFVKWDDDLDIEVERQDYELFLTHLKRELPINYEVIWWKTYPYTKDAFAQVINKNIKVKRCFYNHKSIPNGLPVDIFSYVNSSRSKKRLSHRFWMNINFMRNGRSANDKIFNFFSNFFKIFPQTIVRKKNLKHWQLESDNGNNWSICFFKENKNTNMDINGKYVDILFENHNFKIHENYDEYLSKRYGEYMVEPNVKNRVTHDIEIIK